MQREATSVPVSIICVITIVEEVAIALTSLNEWLVFLPNSMVWCQNCATNGVCNIFGNILAEIRVYLSKLGKRVPKN